MSSVITTDFERWKAQEAALGKPVALNEFVFANVPGLDPSKDISRDEKLPPAGQIVHRQAVNKAGLASENAVAYSVTLGTDAGDFVFNWIGLINKESGTLAMITHAPEQRKIKTVDGVQGNVLTRSFLLEFNGAATETQITTSAETWQIDFTARLAGMDEIQRLANRDIYGAAAFFGDGFLVTKAAEQYRVTPGAAYIEGLRGTLEEITAFNNLRDTKIYVDFTFRGNLVSKWQTFVKVTAAKTLAHYQDAAGFQHYVAVIAEIDQNGNITDKRIKGTAIDRELAELKESLPNDYATKTEVNGKLAKDQNGADIPNKPKFIENLGLGELTKRFVILNSAESQVRSGNGKRFIYVNDDGRFGVAGETGSGWGVNKDGVMNGVMVPVACGGTGGKTAGEAIKNLGIDLMTVPVGASVIWSSLAAIPANFWPNEGRSFSASEYPELATVFPDLKLPDDRGMYIRIADNGKGIDKNRTVGTFQDYQMKDAVGYVNGRTANEDINGSLVLASGMFSLEEKKGGAFKNVVIGNVDRAADLLKFDLSRVMPTGDQINVKNTSKILITRVK
ncbi:phage tail-collar fiber domain-containing protein [Morganella morganii]|uniref:phage tail-collar fiber domain-containing protein n=1 Tax=Morganella morganii TaxID=582 RepID=UPI0034E53C80